MPVADVYAPLFLPPLGCTITMSDHVLLNPTLLKVLQSHVALDYPIDATRLK